METAILMLFGILLSAAVGAATNNIANQNAKNEARAADARQLENQKELMRYQQELAQETNTIATQKGHAAEAGYNPALLYGNMPGLADISSGSAQGTMPELNKVLSKMPTGEIASFGTELVQSRLLARQVANQERVGESEFMKNMSVAIENMRNTKFQKKMETVLYNKGMAELDLLGAQKQGIDISNVRASLMLPGELEQQGLINEQIATQIKDTTEKMKNYPVERAKMRAEIKEINSVIERNNHLNALTDADLQYTQERYRGTVVERIMKEYGLTNRMLPAWLRKDEIANYYLRQPQLLGATAQLVSLGFSQEEAVQTVLWYTGSESKDVTPSAVNAISRGISALILKK